MAPFHTHWILCRQVGPEHMHGYMHHIDDRSCMIQLSYTMTTELETTRKEENVRWAAGHSKVLYIRCRSLIQGLFLPNLFATLVIKYEKLKCTHPKIDPPFAQCAYTVLKSWITVVWFPQPVCCLMTGHQQKLLL